jgi:hypothetical protein
MNCRLNHWTEWNHQIGNPQYATEYEGIYFIRSASVETGKRYLVVIPVLRGPRLWGMPCWIFRLSVPYHKVFIRNCW